MLIRTGLRGRRAERGGSFASAQGIGRSSRLARVGGFAEQQVMARAGQDARLIEGLGMVAAAGLGFRQDCDPF